MKLSGKRTLILGVSGKSLPSIIRSKAYPARDTDGANTDLLGVNLSGSGQRRTPNVCASFVYSDIPWFSLIMIKGDNQ